MFYRSVYGHVSFVSDLLYFLSTLTLALPPRSPGTLLLYLEA